MSRFFNLYLSRPRSGDDPGQDFIEAALPAAVAGSRMRWWPPGGPVVARGTRVLIGVGSYCLYDLRLLDVVDEALAHHPPPAPRVDVFSTLACQTAADFARYIPNLPPLYHTPVVGIWQDGRLIEADEGYAARDRLARMFGSSSDEIVAFVQDFLDSGAAAPAT